MGFGFLWVGIYAIWGVLGILLAEDYMEMIFKKKKGNKSNV